MIRLSLKDRFNESFKFNDDISRIQSAVERLGYVIGRSDAETAWKCYSDSYAASWHVMDGMSDEAIYVAIKPFVEEAGESVRT